MGNKRNLWLYLVVLLIAASGSFLCFQQYRRYKGLTQSLQQEERLLVASRERLFTLRELDKKKEHSIAELEALRQMLPAEPAEDRLLRALQLGADLTLLDLQQVSFGEREEKEGYLETPLQLILGGTYNDLLNFLEYLQDCGRALRIAAIEIKKETDSEEIKIKMQVAVFMLAERRLFFRVEEWDGE